MEVRLSACSRLLQRATQSTIRMPPDRLAPGVTTGLPSLPLPAGGIRPWNNEVQLCMDQMGEWMALEQTLVLAQQLACKGQRLLHGMQLALPPVGLHGGIAALETLALQA